MDLEEYKLRKQSSYWTGRQLVNDDNWDIAKDIVETIKYAEELKSDLLNPVSESFTDKLRRKFFNECTDENPVSPRIIRKVNMTPHNVFEWFKNNYR